jgi:hypothetical protein
MALFPGGENDQISSLSIMLFDLCYPYMIDSIFSFIASGERA